MGATRCSAGNDANSLELSHQVTVADGGHSAHPRGHDFSWSRCCSSC
jgi:hypothetical protein